MHFKSTTLIKFSLIIFLISFCSLYYIESLEPESKKIAELSPSDNNRVYLFNVNILENSNSNSSSYFKFYDSTGIIDGIYFEKLKFKPKLNQLYQITASVTLYNQERELIVRELKPINNENIKN